MTAISSFFGIGRASCPAESPDSETWRAQPFVSVLARESVAPEPDTDELADEVDGLPIEVESLRQRLAALEARQAPAAPAAPAPPATPHRDTAGAILANLAQREQVDPKSITRNLRRSVQFEPLRHYCAARGSLLQSDKRILRWLSAVPVPEAAAPPRPLPPTRYRLLLNRAVSLADLLEDSL